MKKRFSVLLSSRDRWSELGLLLQSLRTQTFQEFDIIIIDGSETPIFHSKPLVDLITRMKVEGHDIVVEKAQILGVCESRNQAIELEKKHYSENLWHIRLDDDVIIVSDYLERMVKLFNKGAHLVSGVTPLLGQPEFRREIKHVGKVINRIQFSENGDLNYYGDDCGFAYLESAVLPAHHLRSCFGYVRDITDSGVRYELGIGQVGFREEDFFCLRSAWQGWNKMLVDTGAIAWHIQTASGGCRFSDYGQQVALADSHFRKWIKRMYQKNGCPFNVK